MVPTVGAGAARRASSVFDAVSADEEEEMARICVKKVRFSAAARSARSRSAFASAAARSSRSTLSCARSAEISSMAENHVSRHLKNAGMAPARPWLGQRGLGSSFFFKKKKKKKL